MAKGGINEVEMALARSLFRTDKWDPARDKDEPFEWAELGRKYVTAAKRLMRTFEKDGLVLMIAPAAGSGDPGRDDP